VEKIEIAGPGFINFFMSQGANASVVNRIIEQGAGYGSLIILVIALYSFLLLFLINPTFLLHGILNIIFYQ
jgi:arginyl-tRNA synthetase